MTAYREERKHVVEAPQTSEQCLCMDWNSSGKTSTKSFELHKLLYLQDRYGTGGSNASEFYNIDIGG